MAPSAQSAAVSRPTG